MSKTKTGDLRLGSVRECYRAIMERDSSYDGKLFFAVRTTGIYCRPICPARRPLERNVAFYASQPEAEAAGFRACRRCRPETAPGSAAWAGTSALVGRALRILREEGLPEEGWSALSERLGVGQRQLRRLFVEHLGAAPHAVWRGMRLDQARELLAGTRLPVSEVALASGFRSLRRFNDEFKTRFGKAPARAREAAGGGSR